MDITPEVPAASDWDRYAMFVTQAIQEHTAGIASVWQTMDSNARSAEAQLAKVSNSGQAALFQHQQDEAKMCRGCHERLAGLENQVGTNSESIANSFSAAGKSDFRLWSLAKDLIILILAASVWLYSTQHTSTVPTKSAPKKVEIQRGNYKP